MFQFRVILFKVEITINLQRFPKRFIKNCRIILGIIWRKYIRKLQVLRYLPIPNIAHNIKINAFQGF